MNGEIENSQLKIKYSYPYDEEYEITTRLERINLDEEKQIDIEYNKGFIIEQNGEIKKDIKNPGGIFSNKFGQTLSDLNPYMERYKCECGETTGRINNDITCKFCGSKVKFIDDDFNYFGWIVIKPAYCIIHPNLYKSLAFFIGNERLERIILPIVDKDKDGYTIKTEKNIKDEPFIGIGILEFKERFKEVIDFYNGRFGKTKSDYYEDILLNKDKVFINSIPVYTTHLRPYRIEGESFYFGDTNGHYNMMAKLANRINQDELKMHRQSKPKKELLYDLQIKYNKLYKEIEDTLSGKKGYMRGVFGGRYNFTARSVIVSNPTLHVDEVTLSYKALVVLMQQIIINILHKSHNMSYSDAEKIWYHSYLETDERVEQIIKTIIKESGRGIPILINRNPTIQYGSIMQMYVVGFTDTYTMELPLPVLESFGADFDGDALNILFIINKSFLRAAELSFNPRNAMQIDRNDGSFNNAMNQKRDTLINANTFIRLSRKSYTTEMKRAIYMAQGKEF